MERQGQQEIVGDPGLVVGTATAPPASPEGHFRGWLFAATEPTCPILRGAGNVGRDS